MEPCAAYGPFERQRKPICLVCLEPPLSAVLKPDRLKGHGDVEEKEGGNHDELCGLCNFPICHDTRCRQTHAECGECAKLQALHIDPSTYCRVNQMIIFLHFTDISIQLRRGSVVGIRHCMSAATLGIERLWPRPLATNLLPTDPSGREKGRPKIAADT